MGTVAHYLEVNAPASQCYAWWRGLTNLPQIMPDVESVQPQDGSTDVTHWKVPRAARQDRRVGRPHRRGRPRHPHRVGVGRQLGHDVKNAGAVRFDDHGGTTGVEVSLAYDPPAGLLGDAVAKIFADPQDKVEKALQAFKTTIEAATPGTGGPTVKQH
jgi:uncharacterized membrane protein